LKNRSQIPKEFTCNTPSPEFIPKTFNGTYELLRLERDPSKLDISEESSFYENVGNAMEEYFVEIQNIQEDLLPKMKNEYLFMKEIIESHVKHSKV
jgi:hypothetical protein